MKFIAMLNVICLVIFSAAAHGAIIEPLLERELARRGPQEEVPIIVKAEGRARLEEFRDPDRSRRRSKIITALKEAAESQRDLRNYLSGKYEGKAKQLWIINGLALKATSDLIRKLAVHPRVKSIVLDETVTAPVVTCTSPAPAEWNIAAIGAPQLWEQSHYGAGVVVASMDTGVDATHPDLQDRWRGGSNSWFDPHGEHPLPADVHGHGTGTMGLMVGGSSGGTAIGVAPGAQWIAVKMFDDAGTASYSDIHLGYQWLLDPDGNPDIDDAPDVINNSWGLQDPNHLCITEFKPDLEILKAAGIAVTFAAGNDGPSPATSTSPANNGIAVPVGAVDAGNQIAPFSSRGPSACGGIFPAVVAPGVSVLTAGLYFGFPGAYATVSGTSFAAPHLSGAIALLMGAFPSFDASVIEQALTNSATDLGLPGPDFNYGNGMIDVFKASGFLRKKDSIGVYRGGTWYLDRSGNGAWMTEADATSTFGIPGDIPVTGDWDGGGKARVGVFRNGYWFLDANGNGAWDEGVDSAFTFGVPGDVPVTGDWTGSSMTRIGVYRQGTWFLDLNGNSEWDVSDVSYSFGIPDDKPVTGDWTGSGTTKIGVVRGNAWFLDMNGNGAWEDGIDAVYSFGIPGDVPVTGDWTGSGTTKIGVVRGGSSWFLDTNGNGRWDDSADQIFYGFGVPGDAPVTGNW